MEFVRMLSRKLTAIAVVTVLYKINGKKRELIRVWFYGYLMYLPRVFKAVSGHHADVLLGKAQFMES